MNRTLNDIIPPSRRRQMTDIPVTPVSSVSPATNEGPLYDVPPAAPKPPRRGFPFGTLLLALVIVAGCAGILYAFSGAKVEITPTVNAASISADFTATVGSGELPYQLVTIDKVATKSVPAESTATANDPAQGTITIYNAQTVPQTLIKNTRFESSDGFTFRIHDPVSVPAGTPAAPGSVTATVYADQGGDKYNIAPTIFTLPGLKGSKAFTLVTAKSTAAMAGGFSGNRPSVSAATDDQQHTALRASLQSDLASSIAAKAPQGYVFVPGGSFTSYQAQPDTAGDKGTVNVSVKGTVTAVVFPADALAKAVAYKVAGTYTGQPVILQDPEKLTLKPNSTTPPGVNDPFSFNLSGPASIAWKVDSTRIAGAVAGKTRESAQSILSGFPEVEKAVLILRPFWTSTFPSDPAKITVTVGNPASGK